MDENTERQFIPREEKVLKSENKPFNPSFLVLGATLIILLNIFAFTSLFLISYLQKPPSDFPLNKPIAIEMGTSLREVVKIMKEENVVSSEYALYIYMLLRHEGESVKAGKYIFGAPLKINEVAESLIAGDNDSDLVRLTFTEGEPVKTIADRAKTALTAFDKNRFLELAYEKEGYLFPETYLVPASFTAEDLYTLMSDTFSEKINTVSEKIQNQKLTLEEIIILASILEREANTVESKKIVSGILQKRLEIGMALQVDASMEYILGKPLSELTADDLKRESPYNTYLNRGLPPTAIGNPGMAAINAILEPTPTEYFFYITGNDGQFYYAVDFDGHRRNIARYLR
jgi:UPF0755 protein